MSERISEADLQRWDTDEVYQSRPMARPPIILLVAEVRRQRRLLQIVAGTFHEIENLGAFANDLKIEMRALAAESRKRDLKCFP